MQYVYLIKCRSVPEYHKVGVALDVENRMAQLQTGSPFELVVEDCFAFDNAEIVERAIHQAWKNKRVRGEWFEMPTALGDFQSICQMLGGLVTTLDNYKTTENDVEEAESTAVSVYCFNCDANGNHYVYMMDENNREPNGRKRRVYLWKFSDPRTTEYCGERANLWLANHACKNVIPVTSSEVKK